MSENQSTPTPVERLKAYGEIIQQIAEDLHRVNNELPMLEGQDTIHGHLAVQTIEEFRSKQREVLRQKTEALTNFSNYVTRLADTSDKQ